MSVQVIVKGDRRPEDRIYRNTCNHCGSLLQFKASDGHIVSGQYHDGPSVVVNCPECKHDVWTAQGAYQKEWSEKDIKSLARRMGGSWW